MDITSSAGALIDQIGGSGILDKISEYAGKITSKLSHFLGVFSGTVEDKIPEKYAPYISGVDLVVTLAFVVVCVLIAFYAERIFKIAVTVAGAFICGSVGAVLASYVVTHFSVPDILSLSLPAIAGLIFALLGVGISRAVFSLILFIVGAGGSAVLSYTVITMTGIITDLPKQLIASFLCAIIGGVLMVIFFKFLYILGTSMGGMAVAGLLMGMSIAPESTKIKFAILGVCLIIGLFAMRYQYKNSSM